MEPIDHDCEYSDTLRLADIEELERLEKEANCAPWLRYHYAAWDGIEDASRQDICCFSNSDWEADGNVPTNLQLIIQMRNKLPSLLQAARAGIEARDTFQVIVNFGKSSPGDKKDEFAREWLKKWGNG